MPASPAGYVTDAAGVLDESDIKALSTRCAQLDKARKAQIAIVTIDSLGGEPIESAAHRLFKRWGIGRKGINDGVLVMLAMRDHKSRITVGYGLEQKIPSGAAKAILEAMRPDLHTARYGAALNLALDRLAALLSP